MGIKITRKSLGHDPNEDYKWIKKSLEEEGKVLDNSEKQLKSFLKNPNFSFIQIGKRDLYAVNKLKYKNCYFLLPEGNPVTYYYSIANSAMPHLEEAKLLLYNILKEENSVYKSNTIVTFSFIFKLSANGIIFSFLALEAFINQCLPEYGKIEFKKKIVDKNAIQRYLSFEDKFKIIVPQVTQKDFINEHPRKVEFLLRLKRLRDQLTHLKEVRKDNLAAYDDIYNDILNADIKKMVNTVKFYINYHKPKTIQNNKRKKQNMAKVLLQELGEDQKGKFVKYYYEDFNK